MDTLGDRFYGVLNSVESQRTAKRAPCLKCPPGFEEMEKSSSRKAKGIQTKRVMRFEEEESCRREGRWKASPPPAPQDEEDVSRRNKGFLKGPPGLEDSNNNELSREGRTSARLSGLEEDSTDSKNSKETWKSELLVPCFKFQ